MHSSLTTEEEKSFLKSFRWIPWKVNSLHIDVIGFNTSAEWKTSDSRSTIQLRHILKRPLNGTIVETGGCNLSPSLAIDDDDDDK
jgi:hypothetical protein